MDMSSGTGSNSPLNDHIPISLVKKSIQSVIRPLWIVFCTGLLFLAAVSILPQQFTEFRPYFFSLFILAVFPFLVIILKRAYRPFENFYALTQSADNARSFRLGPVVWFRSILLILLVFMVPVLILNVLDYPLVLIADITTLFLIVTAVVTLMLDIPEKKEGVSEEQVRGRRFVFACKGSLLFAAFAASAGYVRLGWRIYLLLLTCIIGGCIYQLTRNYFEKLLKQFLHAEDLLERFSKADRESSFTGLMFAKHRTGMARLLRFFLRNIFFFFGLYIVLLTAGMSHRDLAAAVQFPLFSFGSVLVSLGVLLKMYITIVVAYVIGRTGKHFLLYYVMPRAGLDAGTSQVLSNVAFVIIIGSGIITALLLAGVNFMALGVIGGGLAVGIGFGLQNITNNIISGIILFFERPINVGDVIDVGGTPGTVRQIGIRSTVITTFDNIAIIIPNSEFIAGRVINWSWGDITMRIDIAVGVAYGSDVKLVKQILLDIASRHNLVKDDPAPEVMFSEFADSSLNFDLRIWIKDLRQRKYIISDINYMIDHAFRKADIEIPFPQSDVYIRSMPETPPPPEAEPPSASG